MMEISFNKVNLRVNNVALIREIKFYKTASEKCPIEEFLETLSAKQAQKSNLGIESNRRLTNYPNEISKKLVNTAEVWEVWVAFGNNIFRLLGFFDGSNLIVLDNAFQKKTQKIPLQEIQLAEERK